MKHSNLLKALRKVKNVKEDEVVMSHVTHYRFNVGDYVIEWDHQPDSNYFGIHAYTLTAEANFDHRSDGWYGFFPTTIKSCVEWLEKGNEASHREMPLIQSETT